MKFNFDCFVVGFVEIFSSDCAGNYEMCFCFVCLYYCVKNEDKILRFFHFSIFGIV